jgi:hypothetical protein
MRPLANANSLLTQINDKIAASGFYIVYAVARMYHFKDRLAFVIRRVIGRAIRNIEDYTSISQSFPI